MEFPIPRRPPGNNNKSYKKTSLGGADETKQKVEECPRLEQPSHSTESLDINDDEDMMNSFENEDESNDGLKETDGSVQPEGGATKTPHTTKPVDHDSSGNTSPSIKEEISMLYKSLPEIANHFTIIKMIGEGTFSSVFLARLRHHPEIDQLFALKHIIPTSHPCRIENELRCLLNIGGQDNVMGVKLCVRNRDHVVIVMPYFEHQKFQDYLYQMGVPDAREYMKNLLVALRRVHHFDIIHRDIKPSNFLYNPHTKQYALVDFGLATGPLLTDPSKFNQDRYTSVSHASSSLLSSSSLSKTNSATVTPSSTHATKSTTTAASASRGRSREPLSPWKKDAGERNFVNINNIGSSRTNFVNRTEDRNKEKCLPAGKMFAPSASGVGAMGRQAIDPCSCFGKPMICELCVTRSMQLAPRAGTAGFRAPEVLLKSPHQGTAVDVWAAGVIFLSILSARYPFFKANDDLGFLAQIISLVGTEPCVKAAKTLNKQLTLSETIPPIHLESACQKLRSVQMASRNLTSPNGPSSSSSLSSSSRQVESWSDIRPHAYHLLGCMLDPNPTTRISAEAALNHPFFTAEADVAEESEEKTIQSVRSEL